VPDPKPVPERKQIKELGTKTMTKSKNKYQPDMNSSFQKKLGYLIEECGEVLQAAGKSERWGLSSVNPELPPEQQVTNGKWLRAELADLRAAIDLMDNVLQAQGY